MADQSSDMDHRHWLMPNGGDNEFSLFKWDGDKILLLFVKVICLPFPRGGSFPTDQTPRDDEYPSSLFIMVGRAFMLRLVWGLTSPVVLRVGMRLC